MTAIYKKHVVSSTMNYHLQIHFNERELNDTKYRCKGENIVS